MAINKPSHKRSALVTTFTFSPDLNGVAMASSLCVRALLNGGWKVDVATSGSKIPRTSSLWEGATVHEFNLPDYATDNTPNPAESQRYRDFLARDAWDVIIFQGYLWPLHLALPLLPSLKSKKVLVSHGHAAFRWTPVPKFPFGLWRWLRSVIWVLKIPGWSRHIDRWVFLSEQADLDAYLDHSIARLTKHPGRRVIPNGVELPSIELLAPSFRMEHGIAHDAIVFLCIAYYSRGKDQGFAVQAFRRANIHGSVMVFIGTEFNQWSEKIQALDKSISARKNNGRVLWLEKIPRETTLAALAECDIYILPSHLETQPISILEAMSYGKPWIARKAGCIPNLPGGICVNSPTSMARAMIQLTTDKQSRIKFGATGHRAAENIFNRESHIRSYQQLFNELIPQ